MTSTTVDLLNTGWPCEVPVRDDRGHRRVLRAWPESGRVALECRPDGKVYVDLADISELVTLLTASAHRAAVLAAEPDDAGS